MSLGARATKGGAKKEKQEKGKTAEKPTPKEKTKPQATTEQLRMANMIDCKSEDPSDVRRMVVELMEMTRRTEEEVCSALHDTNNDIQSACNLLFEESQRIQGEWQTTEKKKKKPPAPAGNGDVEPPRDAPRSRSGPRTRRGEPDAGGATRGRGGAGRGRGGARGGRGAGRGGRRGAGRPHAPRSDADWPQAPDNADYISSGNIDSFPATEDWDNEEWSGSLSDTKVFTPSVNAQNAAPEPDPAQNATEDWECGNEANGPREPLIPTYTYHNTQQHIPQMAGATNAAPPAKSEPEQYHQPHHQPMGMSGSLSAAQSQYLSQLTQQAQRHDNSVYTSNYGVYGTSDISTQRKTQRVRVPPPSKIPSSAVEMPGGAEGGAGFLDVQFGALDDALHEHAASPHPPPAPAPAPAADVAPKQVTSQAEPAPVSTSHETTTEAPSSYPNANSMLSESLSVVDTTATSQPVTSESTVTNSSSLDKLSVSMKQLGVSGVTGVSGVSGVTAATGAPGVPGVPGAAGVPGATSVSSPDVPPQTHHHYAHHRPKTVGQQNVYATHHAVTHHPPVYSPNVYAPQVNSTNASLTGASLANAYPSSVTLTQYQPIINSYQQQTPAATTVSGVSAYGGSALYTAPYSAAHPHAHYHHPPKHHKDQTQYDSTVPSSNSLTSTSTTQSNQTTPKATTTTGTVSGAASAGAAAGGAGYAGGALYGGAYAYDEQLLRSGLPHHMGGYYEVGYSAREGTFGLGGGERFGRTDAASPQQVPAALPPGYAYFYQPPPTTYQYGVYPAAYGGGSSVGGVGGVGGVGVGVGGVSGGGKVSAYSQQQQPPYDAQDTYKTAGPYTANANKTGGAASADLSNTMYPKTHVALNKVNSYEKAGFHSGTPPPFGAGSHLYIPAPPHHHPHHHAPQQHQMDGRVNSSHNRRESASSGRSGAAKPAASKPTYSQSYWTPN